MKLYLCAPLLVAMLAACSEQPEPADLEQELRHVLETQQAAWNRGDLEGFLMHYQNSPELLFISAGGVLRGHRELAERYASAYATPERMGVLAFDIVEVVPAGVNHAYVVGSWQLQRDGDAPGGYFSLLLQKINNQWTIIADHTS